MVMTLNIHLTIYRAYVPFRAFFPSSLLVLLQLTQGEGEEHGVPHPQRGRLLVRARCRCSPHLRAAVIMYDHTQS